MFRLSRGTHRNKCVNVDIKAYTEALEKLESALVKGDVLDNTIVISAGELLVEIKNRIVKEGRNSQDNAIGQYSTTPIYASQEQFFKKGAFNPQGKGAKFGLTPGDRLIPTARTKTNSTTKNPVRYNKFSVVKPDLTARKTMYLEQGYKQLRDIQGLETQFMNFKYRGDLMNSYQMQKITEAVLLGLTDEKSAKKREGLENRFGNTFYATQEETDNYIAKTNFLLRRITQQFLTGGVYVTATID